MTTQTHNVYAKHILSVIANGRVLTTDFDTHRNQTLFFSTSNYRSVSQGYPSTTDLYINAAK